MTCIVGLESHGSVLLAADSAVEVGELTVGWPSPKVLAGAGVAVGCAGEARACDVVLAWHGWAEPDDDIGAWLVGHVARRLRRRLAKCGTTSATLDTLVGCRGELWYLDSAGAAVRCRGRFAVGAGSGVALGALDEALCHHAPSGALQRALSAAARWCPSVGPPWVIVEA